MRDRETVIEKSVNNLMLDLLKQSWRLRRHPLIERSDLYQPIEGIDLPVTHLANHVTDKIEECNRRIVAFDKNTNCFVIYCPTIYALNDLWAACDTINNDLIEQLITGEENPIMKEFELRAVNIRTSISGPELLKYKNQIGEASKHRMLNGNLE